MPELSAEWAHNSNLADIHVCIDICSMCNLSWSDIYGLLASVTAGIINIEQCSNLIYVANKNKNTGK